MNSRAPGHRRHPSRDLAVGLAKISLFLRQEAWRDRERSGLTPTQAQALMAVLHRRGRRPTLSELAAELGVTAATASDCVRVLVAKGLVQRERSRADGRALALRLTPAGRQEAVAAAQWPDALGAAVDSLTPEEQGALLRVLTKMIRSLQEQGRMPVARMCGTCSFFRPHAHDDPERPHHCAFVDAAFGDRELRLECQDHEAAQPGQAEAAWQAFLAGVPAPA